MGIKYFVQHASIWNNVIHRVEIDIPNYEGESIELKGVDKTATQLDWNGEENPFDGHVIGSQLKINIYDEGNIDLDELMLTPDLEYRVKYYRDNVLFWSGFLISDGIQQSLSYKPTLTLLAVDGLLSMEGLKINITNPQGIDMGTYVSAIRCPLNMIRQCLSSMGNVLPINWMCETKNTSFFDADVLAGLVSWSPRGEILVMDVMDCFEIFEGILKSFNLHVIQYKGEWWIWNVQDLINNNGIFEGHNIYLGAVSNVNIDFNLIPSEILNQGVRMLNKPISKVKVTYQATRDENIVPNGTMNLIDTVTQNVIYWSGNVPNVYQASIHEGFSGRSTDKYGNSDEALDFVTQVKTGITFHDGSMVGMPFDAKTLFPRFSLGLSVLPYNFPKYTSGEKAGMIRWVEDKPLQLEVTYKTANKLWYLNENGYWIEEGLEQLVVVEQEDGKSLGSKVLYGGKIQKGQYIEISFINRNGSEVNRITRVFDRSYDSLEESKQAIIDIFSNVDQVRANLNPDGWINFISRGGMVGYIPRHYLSDVSGQISTRISLISENSMNEDVVRFQFTSKGGETRIKIPEPENLDTQDIGILKYYIHHNGAYHSAIDDVYINVDENYDVYELNVPAKKDSIEEYELTISSSFSGFLVSSYMNSWADCHTNMKYTRFGISATLTEHYGRDVLRMKSQPYQKIDQNFRDLVCPLNVLNGNMMATSNCSYSAHESITKVTLIEYKLTEPNIEVKHYGSNDNNIS